MTRVFLGKGAHDRIIQVEKVEQICFECSERKIVLEFDSSDGEYTIMRFCIDCLNKFLHGFISSSSYENDYDDIKELN